MNLRPRRSLIRPAAQAAAVDAAFELVERPGVLTVPGFRFAHARVRGPYQPWTRVSTLDHVAQTLETHAILRTGPAFGIYHDLPFSENGIDAWTADLGFPVEPDVRLPALPHLRTLDLPDVEAVGLRYRGDLSSFPGALQLLVDWASHKDLDLHGCLMERFHVSDALAAVEERDVFVARTPLPR